MKKIALMAIALQICVLASMGLNAQEPKFFAENENIVYATASIGGESRGIVEGYELKDDTIVVDVLMEADNNPNIHPDHRQPERNQDVIVYFEDGIYLFECYEIGKTEGTIRDDDTQTSLSFGCMEYSVSFTAAKNDE